MAGFKFLEHTADVYIEAYGETLEEAFIQAAYALFDTMTDLKTIARTEKRAIRVQAEDLHALLFEYIDHFLFLFDVDGLLFSKLKIKINQIENGYELLGEGWGEQFNREKHPPRTEIKAPTYNQMEIIQNTNAVILRFVVDV